MWVVFMRLQRRARYLKRAMPEVSIIIAIDFAWQVMFNQSYLQGLIGRTEEEEAEERE
jgi:hypothetical protein